MLLISFIFLFFSHLLSIGRTGASGTSGQKGNDIKHGDLTSINEKNLSDIVLISLSIYRENLAPRSKDPPVHQDHPVMAASPTAKDVLVPLVLLDPLDLKVPLALRVSLASLVFQEKLV